MISVKASFGRRAVAAGFLVALAANAPTPGAAQTNPFVGAWVLNVAKSKFTPGPAPKSQTAIYEVVGAGLRVSATGVDAQGKPINTQYTANFDGKDYPVTGNADYDAIVLKRVDAHSMEFTRKRASKVVQTGTNVVSKDGKTRTITVDGTNAQGQTVHNVSVYDKK
jgi:formylglycine-generating enzyme required for sulfatase activity